MIFHSEPKRFGSYVLMDSARIQEEVPLFVASIRKEQEKQTAEYIQSEMTRRNNFRRWFRWIGFKQLNYARTEWQIRDEQEDGSISQRIRHLYKYPNEYGNAWIATAENLLAMSKASPRVFISAKDFNAVFRGRHSRENNYV